MYSIDFSTYFYYNTLPLKKLNSRKIGMIKVQGWVSIHRKIINNPVWQDPKLLKLWMLCLLEATHKEHKQIVGNILVDLHPGQFVTGRFSLASEYNKGAKKKDEVSDTTLWRWLKNFESMGFIKITSHSKYSIVTVNNWNQYQKSDEQIKKAESPSATRDSRVEGFKNEQIMNRKMNRKVDRKKSALTPGISRVSEVEDFENGQQMNRKMDTNNNVLEEEEEEEGEIVEVTSFEQIQNKFLQRRGRGFDISPDDEMSINRIIEDEIPVEKILQWIDEIFDAYKPKHRLDNIKKFTYLEKGILDRWAELQKGEPIVKTGSHQKYNDIDWENL